jgi:hypothetical protein
MAEDNVPRNREPSDDPPSDGTGHDNATPANPTGGPAPLDATAEYSPLDETAEHTPPPDQTRVGGPPTTDPGLDPANDPAEDAGPTGTGVLPAVGDTEPPRWSARAQVPQHDVGYGEWQEVEEEQERRNLVTPALITLCVLLLLALIALGVWLSMRDRDTPPTNPTPTPVPTTVAPTTTPPPTTTTPPAPTQAAEVAIPTVRGMSYAEAVAALNGAGFFQIERVNEVSELPEGQVIGTNPPAGNAVLPNATIEVRVSTGLPQTTTTPPPSTPAG